LYFIVGKSLSRTIFKMLSVRTVCRNATF